MVVGVKMVCYSVSPRIINGWFRIHISYMGTPNITRKLNSMRTSPDNIVITKIGDTYVINQGDTKSKVTPRKAAQVVITFNVGLIIVRYNT